MSSISSSSAQSTPKSIKKDSKSSSMDFASPTIARRNTPLVPPALSADTPSGQQPIDIPQTSSSASRLKEEDFEDLSPSPSDRPKRSLSLLKQQDSSAPNTDEEDDDEDIEGAKDKLRREKERLKYKEERLKTEEIEKKKKEKEAIRKEKERLKKEKEDQLRKVKEEMKRETQKLYRKEDDIVSGFVKMRSPFKKWNLRYFVLISGKLIYYHDEFEKDCLGIILLNGCQVSVRKSKKEGFCFKIWHPKGANIYSNKGLKGEALASGMVPVSADHCIMRVTTEDERTKWIEGIATSINRISNRKNSMISQKEEEENVVLQENSSPTSSPSATKTLEEIQISETPKRPRKIKETQYSLFQDELVLPDQQGEEETLDQTSSTLILSLLKQVKIGMDLSRVALPTFILEPRSMLEKLSDYLTHADLLSLVPKVQDPKGRLLGVLKWYLSAFYIKPKGVKKPYNPILGELFRCMWTHSDDSKTFFVSEQVSHHPPISAFYASNRKSGFVINGSILFRSKFLGTSAASILDGCATLYVTPFDEEYEITFPSAHAKGFLFGTLIMELVGPVHIICRKTGYSAEIEFKAKPMLKGEYNVLNAKVKHEQETLYTIKGKWDNRLDITDASTKETSVFWEPTIEVRKNKNPKYKPDVNVLKDFESDKLWKKVSDAIRKGDQDEASLQKFELEQAQRVAAKKRQNLGIEYKPHLFRKDEKGIWVYKYANRSIFNQDLEIEEYEFDGVIRSKHQAEESGSDDSEPEEEPSNPLIVQETAPVKIPKTTTSSSSSLPSEEWQLHLENRLLAIEKKLISLQMKKPEEKKEKGSSKVFVVLCVLVVILAYLMGKKM